jgi:hypothetical protein
VGRVAVVAGVVAAAAAVVLRGQRGEPVLDTVVVVVAVVVRAIVSARAATPALHGTCSVALSHFGHPVNLEKG